MSEELKPCPFCGGGAKLYKHDIDVGGSGVGCKLCEFVGIHFATDQDAIAAWNTRTTDHTDLVRQLVEALGEAEAIAEDHINLLENQGWTRHKADEIKMANVMLENIQQSLTAAKASGF